jgi:hypothetical protein
MKLSLVIGCAALALLGATGAFAEEQMFELPKPSDTKWQPAPPVFPKGAEFVLLSGSMEKGPWVIRLKWPAGYVLPAHVHKNIENVTVIDGDINIGMGNKTRDKTHSTTLVTGGYLMMPPDIPHSGWTDNGVVIQVHSDTPAGIVYLNADEDPSKKKQ